MAQINKQIPNEKNGRTHQKPLQSELVFDIGMCLHANANASTYILFRKRSQKLPPHFASPFRAYDDVAHDTHERCRTRRCHRISHWKWTQCNAPIKTRPVSFDPHEPWSESMDNITKRCASPCIGVPICGPRKAASNIHFLVSYTCKCLVPTRISLRQ